MRFFDTAAHYTRSKKTHSTIADLTVALMGAKPAVMQDALLNQLDLQHETI